MNLRYIIRNGKEVLQYYTDGEITNWGVLHGCWTDVPLVQPEPVQVAEQTVTVTREQIAVAWANSVGERPAVDYLSGRSPMFNDLCKELGFKDE